MQKSLIDTLKEKVLVCDGAMGTQLMVAGLKQGECGELWNITHPERVLEIQRRYVDAGSNCIITNTFGGNGRILSRHGHMDKLAEINREAARIARESFGDSEGFVLGDVGPVGEPLEPYGDLSQEDASQAISIQVEALMEGGVDAIIVETQSALEETAIGVTAAKEAGAPCIIASLSFNILHDKSGFRTMMGVSPEQAAQRLSEMGVDVLALNCGSGVDMTAAHSIICNYRNTSNCFTMAQPNAGLPVLENQIAVYKQTPEDMTSTLNPLLEAGVNIVGGCCGTTPDHIRSIREKVDAWNAR